MNDWKSNLDNLFSEKEKKTQAEQKELSKAKAIASEFISNTVLPAFEEIKLELEKHGREVAVSGGQESATINVEYEGHREISYSINVGKFRGGTAHPFPETRSTDKKTGSYYISEGYLRAGSQDYTTDDITKNEIVEDFISKYKHTMR